MPQCCAVSECSNRKSGHRFPKDKDLKKWMVVILSYRVEKSVRFHDLLTGTSAMTTFPPKDFAMPKDSVLKNSRPILRKDVVPSCFGWTRRASDIALKKPKRNNQLQSQIATMHCIESSDLVTKKQVINTAPPPLVYFSQPTEVLGNIEHVNLNEIKAEPIIFLNGPDTEGAEFHVETDYHARDELNVMTEYHNKNEHLDQTYRTENAGIQCSMCTCGSGPGEECHSKNKASQSITVTNHISTCFQIECLLHKVDDMKFYTGFNDYDNFMFVFNLLGDKVNSIQYFATDQICTQSHVLSPRNQFFMTMVKLRCNMTNEELGLRFGLSSSYAGINVATWINFLYSRLKVWVQSEEIGNYLKLEEENRCSAGISASSEENNPIVITSDTQKQTYVIYKFCNMFKVIVGILPNRWVNTVSEAFGKSIKNGELFEKFCLENLLQDGDVILCDEGFEDFVTYKNVTFEIPDFLNLKPDLYQRFIHLETTFEILQSRLSGAAE